MKQLVLSRIPALTLALSLLACSESRQTPELAEDVEPDAADVTASSAEAGVPGSTAPYVPIVAPGCGGRALLLPELRIDNSSGLSLSLLSAEPEVPVVGNSSWLVALESEVGSVVAAASRIEVIPYMPDHGHGTAVAVEVYEEAPGRYRLAPINLRMPGYWEITLTLTGDSGVQSIMVPVCVD
jgi:YtkA-like